MQSHELGIYMFKERQKKPVSEYRFAVYWFNIPFFLQNLEVKWDTVNRSQGPLGNPRTISDRYSLKY